MSRTKPLKNETTEAPETPSRHGVPSRLDIILGLIGIFAAFYIPYVWWGAIKTLAGR